MLMRSYDSNFGFATSDGLSSSFDHPPRRYDTRRYCVDWLNQAASLSLARATAPEQPLFDSEFHVVSANKWRVRATTAAAARSIRLKVVHGPHSVTKAHSHTQPSGACARRPRQRRAASASRWCMSCPHSVTTGHTATHIANATRHAPRASPMVRPRGHLAHHLCTPHQPPASALAGGAGGDARSGGAPMLHMMPHLG